MQIVKKSKIWFSISFAFIFFSLATLVYTNITINNFLRYGLDFTGGTLMEITITDQTKTTQNIQQALEKYLEYTPTVQATEAGSFLIKMKNISNEVHQDIMQTLTTKLGTLEENKFITIGPSIGETLKKKAFFTLIIALVVIVIYIAFAFRGMQKKLSSWKFGLSAIIALAHDSFITIGIFTFLGIFLNAEIDALFITAILTIMGFSVHDTIVTFDRIRENVRFARSNESLEDIAEKSIKQTITRSINTSLSTLFPLISLFFFGSSTIQMFVLTLIIGIIIGTYSSIFLATPILVKWQKKI